jgi:molecular chaperone DnaJ
VILNYKIATQYHKVVATGIAYAPQLVQAASHIRLMANNNHYETLKINQNASQAEIKQAYRRLVKLFHPDTNPETVDPNQIIRINAAYEVLGDEQNRQSYDRRLNQNSQRANNARQHRTATAQKQQVKRKSGRDIDEQVNEWLRVIYHPVNRFVEKTLSSLDKQIDKLAADPFDDDLLEAFEEYLQRCREGFKQAQAIFRSLPNPPALARTAAHLYYCINQIGDALDELDYFPLNYDESYLHAGQEMFRIATQLHYEAQDAVDVYM